MIDEALSRGEISYAKARALTRVATPVNETRLCELAMAATGAQLERICRRFRRATGELAGVPSADGEDERAVRVRPTASGMLRIEVTLHPDEADLVLLAIDKVRETLSGGAAAPASVTEPTRDVSAETRPVPSRADAVVLLAEQALSGEGGANESGAVASGGGRHQVFIHLDRSLVGPTGEWDVFLDDGTRLSPEAFRRVSCDVGSVADGDIAEMASLRPDTDTSLCRWDGDLVDYDWAVDALIAAGGP